MTEHSLYIIEWAQYMELFNSNIPFPVICIAYKLNDLIYLVISKCL